MVYLGNFPGLAHYIAALHRLELQVPGHTSTGEID